MRLCHLRRVSDSGVIDAACIVPGRAFRLAVDLTPPGALGAAPAPGMVWQRNPGHADIPHPRAAQAGLTRVAVLDIDCGADMRLLNPGIGDQYWMTDVNTALPGLAILDQADHGRRILLGVLANHARSVFSWTPPNVACWRAPKIDHIEGAMRVEF